MKPLSFMLIIIVLLLTGCGFSDKEPISTQTEQITATGTNHPHSLADHCSDINLHYAADANLHTLTNSNSVHYQQ